MYKRKTRDVWYLMGNCGYGWDCECVYDNLVDAKQGLREYITNCPIYAGKTCHYRLEKKRERIQEVES